MDSEIFMDSSIENEGERLAKAVGELLRENGYTISIAESCTGGFVSNLITSIQGSSDYFEGGIIAYSNRIKKELLRVPDEILKIHGAVSVEVAVGMAKGIRELMKTDVGISTTGIAGPSGGSEKKPVGMVVFGVDIKGKITTNIEYFEPPRGQIKMQAATFLLKILKDNLKRI